MAGLTKYSWENRPPCYVVLCPLTAAAPKTAQAQSLWSVSIDGGGYVPCSNNEGVVQTAPHYRAAYIADPFEFVPAIFRPAAAVRGETITMTVVLRAGAEPVDCGLAITEHWLGTEDNHEVVAVDPMTNIHIPAYSSQAVVFTITMPNFVKRGPLRIMWKYTYPNGDVSFSGWHMGFYCLYDRPKAPQLNPWVGVLEDACKWAEFQNDKLNVAAACTNGLYDDNAFVYTSKTYFPAEYSIGTPATIFDLKRYLRASRPAVGNCSDISDYLCICLNSAGVDTLSYHVQSTGGSFTANQLLAIGQTTISTPVWNIHQMVMLSDFPFEVFDACLALVSNNLRPMLKKNFDDYWEMLVAAPRPTNTQTASPVTIYSY